LVNTGNVFRNQLLHIIFHHIRLTNISPQPNALARPTPRRGRCDQSGSVTVDIWFQSTPSCGGRPGLETRCIESGSFNPRPPCGGRPSVASWSKPHKAFQSTPPCGGRPVW
jgi:hypothetical protein